MPQDDRLSNLLGTLSILFWLGATFPSVSPRPLILAQPLIHRRYCRQVIVNIRTQSVEGLALPFLANWLFGTSLLVPNSDGSLLTLSPTPNPTPNPLRSLGD